ncbi:MAG: hypothetical protein QOH18_820 [Solirubrobacterales bacterium]|nr:hypothetical protein [Solirubrobacterales bacterium]
MPVNRTAEAGVHSGAAVTDEFLSATTVTFAAMVLFDALSSDEQDRLLTSFDDRDRFHWNFLPEAGRGRRGIPLRDLDHPKQILVHRLVAASLSLEAYARFLQIINLEHLLREMDQPVFGHVAAGFRDPGAYFLSFFGKPGPDVSWGWRLVGHHVSMNFTIIGQEQLVGTPFLFGSEPGRFGPMRPLAEEEELGFRVLHALEGQQRRSAVIHSVSPPDFVTACRPKIGAVEKPALHGDARRDVIITPEDAEELRYERDNPRGIPISDMPSQAQQAFEDLLRCYLNRLPEVWRDREWRRIEDTARDRLYFAWAGAEDASDGHYYRIQGPHTLIEFNNTEGDANHVHSVLRDPDGDFGLQALGDDI